MSDDIAGLSFEDAMAQLEAIVRDLESGKGKLDDAVGAYDRGVRLRRHCEAKLAEAQAKIDKIVAGPDGAVGTEPFDAQS
ncbi:exodeoxyribonuclease VII [Elstera litoralis]|jgi:exodeoxyribonuclease VII small subunit|uniref:Exodeoxyribonuclease 7 small subunit n=1 Tax=Elstera litoralis TaxID=552518 RepID=A0A0F3ISV6_9PROT|nr:exodeoxyribonuclease VII small subunit [Elstera litoralis]KJV09796.1 exodeoxyribonuclease VII [Elstera litoralis]